MLNAVPANAHLPAPSANGVRVATFNVSLNRPKQGQLAADLAVGNQQAIQVATILRIVRPDIVLLNEFDYSPDGVSIRLFREKYLERNDGFLNTEPLNLPYTFTDAVNTGEPSSMDLNKDGKADGPEDAYGFGLFPGQYGMVVLSKYPIAEKQIRTFRKLLWKDLPDAKQPTVPDTGTSWYSKDVWSRLRLSSKSHWDVPINVNGKTLHLLASHPTPPAFDGPENRNGLRNHDEIALLQHLISGDSQTWLTDDTGAPGGLALSAAFVICGDLNADPVDGGSFDNPIEKLMNHSRVQSLSPSSEGAAEASVQQGRKNATHKGTAANDTADFSDSSVGNLRVDYCLPSSNLNILNSGVFWPKASDPHAELLKCSDHRLVWADLAFTE
jgi:hypothetical protein